MIQDSTNILNPNKLMTRISPAGVKKICRNIFTLQQALTNITMNREPALDQARLIVIYIRSQQVEWECNRVL